MKKLPTQLCVKMSTSLLVIEEKEMEVKVVDGVRTFVFKREVAPAAKVSKSAAEQARKAITGRGLAKARNAVRNPSPVIVTTY